MKLDKLDKQLILKLQDNGRLSYMELAKTLGVAEGTIRNRLKKLLGQDIIRVTAVPELGKFGYNFIGIVGMQVRLSDLRTVAEQLSKEPNVCYLANVTGRFELIAIVLAKSPVDFSHFMEDTISNMPSVLRTETFVTLNVYKGYESGLDTSQLISNLDIYSLSKRTWCPEGGAGQAPEKALDFEIRLRCPIIH